MGWNLVVCVIKTISICGFWISGNKYKGQTYCSMGFDFMVESDPQTPQNLISHEN